jgi:hypothetical protein
MVAGSSRRLGSRSNEWAKLGIIGLPVLCLALLVNFSVRRLLLTQGFGQIGVLDFPELELSVPLIPVGSTQFDLGTWVAAWIEGLFHAGLLTAYYVSMGAIVMGALFTVTGFVMTDDPRRLLGGIKLLVHDRRLHVFLLLQVVLWVASFNPWIIAFATELGIIVMAAGSVFLITGSALLVVADRSGPVATILVVHPLGALTVVLPPIAAALVSPMFRNAVQTVTFDLTVWLLLNVLEPVGLSRPLQRAFDLEGVGFILFWASAIVLVGWIVGIVRYLRAEDSLTGSGGSLSLR